jgi:hypothetical protein
MASPGNRGFTFMNTPTIMNNDNQAGTQAEAPDLYTQQCFRSIDGPVLEQWERFPISLLRLGRILTAKEAERRNLSAAQVCRWMDKHRDLMLVSYRPMEVRDYLFNHQHIEIVGGGIRVEWFPQDDEPRRRGDAPHVSLSFYRIYRPEELVVKAPAINLPGPESTSPLPLNKEEAL